MRFSVERTELARCLSAIEGFTAKKSPLTALTGIKIKADQEAKIVSCSATDLEMGIEFKVPAEEIEESGAGVVSSNILGNVVKRLDSDVVAFNADSNNKVNITAGAFQMTLPMQDEADFPEIVPAESKDVLDISCDLFRDMVKKTIHARSNDPIVRAILTGELLEARNGYFNVVALDGYRIAWRWEKIEAEDFSVVVPGKTLIELVKLIAEEDEETESIKIGLAKNGTQAVFKTDKFTVVTRTLAGQFIDYEKLITGVEPHVTVTADTFELLSSLERLYVIAREANENNTVVLNIRSGSIEAHTEADIGSAYEKIECDTKGKELEIAFNAKFLLEAVKTIEWEKTELVFGGELQPCLVKPLNAEGQINFILPVKIRKN